MPKLMHKAGKRFYMLRMSSVLLLGEEMGWVGLRGVRCVCMGRAGFDRAGLVLAQTGPGREGVLGSVEGGGTRLST